MISLQDFGEQQELGEGGEISSAIGWDGTIPGVDDPGNLVGSFFDQYYAMVSPIITARQDIHPHANTADTPRWLMCA